jgi:hypothetical protein
MSERDNLENWTDAELAKALEDHVRKRGEPSLNGAWAMMLEASARLDSYAAQQEQGQPPKPAYEGKRLRPTVDSWCPITSHDT